MDDLVFIAETLCELLEMFYVWKTNPGLCVVAGKTEIMVNAHNAPEPVRASKFPCDVCNKVVAFKSINCLVCGFWVHKCCSNVKGPLKPNLDFKCKKSRGEVSNLTIQDINPVDIIGEEIEKIRSFCYLNDYIRQREGCFGATTARIRHASKKSREFCHSKSM